MNKNIVMLIVLFSIVVNSCAAKSTYKYVEIQECSIPVPATMELIEKTDEYSYSFSTHVPKDLRKFNPKSLAVFASNFTPLEELLQKLKKKDYPLKLIKKFKKGNFTIIQFSFLEWDYNYRIYVGNSMIQLLNSSEKEMNYLVDFCRKTMK